MGAGLLEGVLGFFLELTLDSLVRHWAECFPCSVTGLGSGRDTKGAETGPRRLGGWAEGQSSWAVAWLSAKALLQRPELLFPSRSQHNPNPADPSSCAGLRSTTSGPRPCSPLLLHLP